MKDWVPLLILFFLLIVVFPPTRELLLLLVGNTVVLQHVLSWFYVIGVAHFVILNNFKPRSIVLPSIVRKTNTSGRE
jgi:uncharacterized membrane protein